MPSSYPLHHDYTPETGLCPTAAVTRKEKEREKGRWKVGTNGKGKREGEGVGRRGQGGKEGGVFVSAMTLTNHTHC